MFSKRSSSEWVRVAALLVVFLSGTMLPLPAGALAPRVSANSTEQAVPSDASLDPKDYLGRGDYDFVPTRLVDTLLMETVSDEWLADFDGYGLAEMALGRLPVRTSGEASRIIDKIVSYDSASRTRDILLVSDLNDGIDFLGPLVEVRSLVPTDVNVGQIDRGALGTTAAKNELIESLNRGWES